jgi:type IV pilus assembly protein PilY1
MDPYHRIPPRYKSAILGLLISIIGTPPLLADDVSLYLTGLNPPAPNVLFVLDESSSMQNGQPSRRDQLISAMRSIIRDSSMTNVNAALLGYTTTSFHSNSLSLNARTGDFKIIGDNSATFIREINGLQHIAYTPTVKALEAAVDWFRRDRTFTDTSGATMASPITGDPADNRCRPNHIVLLSDGEPRNTDDPNDQQGYGLTSYEGEDCEADTETAWHSGTCAKEIVHWAYTHDLAEDASWTGTQNITTSTIGFATNSTTENFLESLVGDNGGGGRFYSATDSAQIISAFQNILTTAQQSITYAYTAPTIPFNQDNAAVSGDRIYVPMLVPTATQFWEGNLKSYTISTDAASSDIVLSDAHNDPIIDINYEFVSSQDHWSSSPDGGDPLVNGAAAHMGEGIASRKLYTNMDEEDPHLPLSNSANLVSTTNTHITHDDLGVATDAEKNELINWITWNWTAPTPPPDEAPAPSREGSMGAPIHTHPAVVRYGNDNVIYLPTSEGVLEAIDARTGTELWAFMPKDLLPNISLIKTNTASSIPYYGLDGPLTIYKVGAKTMAIVGMRRGGKSYYMLDISDKDAPVFIAQITDSHPSTAGDAFDGLGQTWSKPFHANVFVGGTLSDVLIFGGGYDTHQDSTTMREPEGDDEGSAIFIVDASDGRLLQKLSNSTTGISGMNNAIAADVVPFDMNRNGIVERIYAADVGGRIIRIDIPESATGSLTGGVIADINAGVGANEFRRFFNTPEIGYYNKNGMQHLAILIGTGNRTKPLDTSVTDRFYMIKDPHVWTAPASYDTVTESNLYDATDNLIQDGSASQRTSENNELATKQGWFINYRSSEKSYSEAVLYNYAVMFTTFSADISNNLSVCEAEGTTGTSRFYAINMVNGTAMFPDLDGDGSLLNIQDRSKELNMRGLPPTANLVFPENGAGMLSTSVKAMVALEEVAEWPNQLIPIWWEEVIPE